MKNKRVDLAQWAIEQTRQSGANQVAVNISNQRDVEIEVRDKKLEKLKESTQNSLSLDIYVDHKYSSHSTNDLRKESLKTFIDEAVASTKYLSRDEFRELPDPALYAKDLSRDLKLVDKQYESVKPEERVKFAEEIEAAAMQQSDKIISTTAGYNDTIYHTVKAHSNGFLGESHGTSFAAGASVTVEDPAGGRPSDWYWSVDHYRSGLLAPAILGENAVKRALQKIGQEKIESGKYTMIVENRSGGRLIGVLRSPMSARALQQKSSYLEGMLGKSIASEKLSLIDDPLIEKGLGSHLYDGEGLAAKKRVFVEKGVLKQYFVDNYYGKKLGMKPTTSSTSNLLFDYGDRVLDDIVKDVEKGILITGFIGGNSNGTTGDFSFGITGLLVENGAIIKPVNEMNISGNANEFWKRLSEVGSDPYPYSSWKIPTLVFDDIDFSGV
jgi:PmbA protein